MSSKFALCRTNCVGTSKDRLLISATEMQLRNSVSDDIRSVQILTGLLGELVLFKRVTVMGNRRINSVQILETSVQ